MKINLGTKNKSKTQAVMELAGFFDWFEIDELNGFTIDSDVSEQPLSVSETILGAKNRSKKAYEKGEADIGIGIEEGIIPIDECKSGWTNFTVCVIYDGKDFYIGTGGGFEYPVQFIDRVLNHGEDLSQAFDSCGFNNTGCKIGEGIGIVGYLTDEKLPRKELIKPSIIYALLQLNKKDIYNKLT